MSRLARNVLGLVALGLAAALAGPLPSARCADTVEMLNGQRFRAEVVREDDERVVLRIRMRTGGGSLELTLKTRDVHAIIKKGSKRRIVNARAIPSATTTTRRIPSRTPGARLTPVEELLGHHAGIYRRCSPAVVGITCKNDRHQFIMFLRGRQSDFSSSRQ